MIQNEQKHWQLIQDVFWIKVTRNTSTCCTLTQVGHVFIKSEYKICAVWLLFPLYFRTNLLASEAQAFIQSDSIFWQTTSKPVFQNRNMQSKWHAVFRSVYNISCWSSETASCVNHLYWRLLYLYASMIVYVFICDKTLKSMSFLNSNLRFCELKAERVDLIRSWKTR